MSSACEALHANQILRLLVSLSLVFAFSAAGAALSRFLDNQRSASREGGQSKAAVSSCVAALVAWNERANGALLQIGAHLAWLNANDPIGSAILHSGVNLTHRSRSRGPVALLVEPQPHIFDMAAQWLVAPSRCESAESCEGLVPMLRALSCDVCY